MDGAWLACANTETPACIKMFFLVSSALSEATSTSLMRLFADERFSRAVARFAMVTYNRF